MLWSSKKLFLNVLKKLFLILKTLKILIFSYYGLNYGLKKIVKFSIFIILEG